LADSQNSFYVGSWAAIVIDPAPAPARRHGACADEPAIPAAMRRRLGSFGRMVVSCGLNLAGEGDVDLVLASQYGDLALAEGLLADVVSGGLLSPAAFAMSVHNAPAGMLDIIHNSKVGHTAIAAGSQTLSAGLIEAWLRLRQRRERPVVLIYADEAPMWSPERPLDVRRPGVALALRLSLAVDAGTLAQVVFSPAVATREPVPSVDLAKRLVDCLEGPGGGRSLDWQAQGLDWLCRDAC